jgi:hypothetical protein
MFHFKRNWMIGAALLLVAAIPARSADLAAETYVTLVDGTGTIRLPEDFRLQWTHLGSWVVADADAPGHGIHDVYTQPEAARAYRERGRFPDGTVLIKAIGGLARGTLTTGDAVWAGEPKIWFVMVKDRAGRFPDSGHWAEGWGWALFEAAAPGVNASDGFEQSCRGCHLPARGTDWVFVDGYPSLR